MRASSKRSSTSEVSCRTWSCNAGRYSSGSANPSSSASSIAVIEASGVRRSWLAQATSWRRASNSSSIEPAISLKLLPSSASSRGPLVGRAGAEISGGELGRRAAETVERAEDPAGEQQRGDDR